MDWLGWITPWKFVGAEELLIGSLTMYCRSLLVMGIGNPPADSMAAVDPAAVQIRRPLDRQFIRDESVLSFDFMLSAKGCTLSKTCNLQIHISKVECCLQK